MTESVLLSIVAGLVVCIPVLITQVAGIIIAMNARKKIKEEILVVKDDIKEDIKVVVQETTLKLDKASDKLDTIHTQTNSNVTELKAQIKALTDRVEELVIEKAVKAGEAKSVILSDAEGKKDE